MYNNKSSVDAICNRAMATRITPTTLASTGAARVVYLGGVAPSRFPDTGVEEVDKAIAALYEVNFKISRNLQREAEAKESGDLAAVRAARNEFDTLFDEYEATLAVVRKLHRKHKMEMPKYVLPEIARAGEMGRWDELISQIPPKQLMNSALGVKIELGVLSKMLELLADTRAGNTRLVYPSGEISREISDIYAQLERAKAALVRLIDK